MKTTPLLVTLLICSHALAVELDVRNAAEFAKCASPASELRRLGTDMRFLEGPQWVPAAAGGYLVFSDIPSNRIQRWTEKEGVTVWREPSGNANGNTVDSRGRVLTAEHGGRRISRTEADGSVTTVADQFEGRKLNSPNDVVVAADGAVYFTDPDYGLPTDPATKQRTGKEQAGDFVYRCDPERGTVEKVAGDFVKPNGLCFSPDGRRLYVADSGGPRHIRVFDVGTGGRLENGRVFCQIDKGGPDGIRCDREGRVWSSAGDGVHVFAPSGELLGKVLVPESPANLAFGGEDMGTLFITARKSLYALKVDARGLR